MREGERLMAAEALRSSRNLVYTQKPQWRADLLPSRTQKPKWLLCRRVREWKLGLKWGY